MEDFTSGAMHLSETVIARIRSEFHSHRLDDQAMLSVIADVYEHTGYLLDPHTAIGVPAARHAKRHQSTPMVCLATAHPAKFHKRFKNQVCLIQLYHTICQTCLHVKNVIKC